MCAAPSRSLHGALEALARGVRLRPESLSQRRSAAFARLSILGRAVRSAVGNDHAVLRASDAGAFFVAALLAKKVERGTAKRLWRRTRHLIVFPDRHRAYMRSVRKGKRANELSKAIARAAKRRTAKVERDLLFAERDSIREATYVTQRRSAMRAKIGSIATPRPGEAAVCYNCRAVCSEVCKEDRPVAHSNIFRLNCCLQVGCSSCLCADLRPHTGQEPDCPLCRQSVESLQQLRFCEATRAWVVVGPFVPVMSFANGWVREPDCAQPCCSKVPTMSTSAQDSGSEIYVGSELESETEPDMRPCCVCGTTDEPAGTSEYLVPSQNLPHIE